MVLFVKCLLCSDILECSSQETSNLLVHIKEKHPNVKITPNSTTDIQMQINIMTFKIADTKDNSMMNIAVQSPVIVNVKKETDNMVNKNENIKENINENQKENHCNNRNADIQPNPINVKSSNVSNGSMIPNLSNSSHSSINKRIRPHNVDNEFVKIEDDFTEDYTTKNPYKTNKKNVWSSLYDTNSPINTIRKSNNQSSTPSTIILNEKNENVLTCIYKRTFKPKKPLIPKFKNNDKFYKTTVEKRSSGFSKMLCSNCGATKYPIIRQRSTRISHSIAGATLLLTCWPFCFSPCLFPPPIQDTLHCSKCNYYLGAYDPMNGIVVPNRNCKKDIHKNKVTFMDNATNKC